MNYYLLIGMIIAVISCFFVYISFERRTISIGVVVILAVFTAIAVVGRIVFFEVPGFKPVSAIVIMAGMYFGGNGGFMVGSLSALISNIYYGQGPWTPFQMLAWGIIGILAGLLANLLKKSRWILYLFAVFSGIFYSMFMDLYSVIWVSGGFYLTKYIAFIITSVPYMIIYAVSNVIFLCLLEKPFSKKIQRLKKKYGI